MLFLDRDKLEATLDRIIDAQPFLGTLANDPSARGLFAALGRLGQGVERQQANSAAYQTALSAFHDAIADALDGHPRPLSWMRLLAGDTADSGPYKFVLAQPRLNHAEIEPGGAALRAMRDAAKKLEFVRSGEARVRITGSVALADEEFATVAQGAVEGMVASTLLITLWLFLAVRSWRLIVPILGTLGLGLALTLFFAATAVGTLNLISVGFGILFVGIAVDFAIQFGVRFRETARLTPDMALALAQTTSTSRRTDPPGGGGDGGRISLLCADPLPRRGRTGPHRRRRNADRLSLHNDLPPGRHYPLSPAARRSRRQALAGRQSWTRPSGATAGRC